MKLSLAVSFLLLLEASGFAHLSPRISSTRAASSHGGGAAAAFISRPPSRSKRAGSVTPPISSVRGANEPLFFFFSSSDVEPKGGGDSDKESPPSSSDSSPTKGGDATSSYSSSEDAAAIEAEDDATRRMRVRNKIAQVAKNIVVRPIVSAAPMPRAIATILRDATLGAVDIAVDRVIDRASSSPSSSASSSSSLDFNDSLDPMDVKDLIDDAFAPMEASLQDMEAALTKARVSLVEAKNQATEAIEAVEAAALAQAEGAATAVAKAEEVAAQLVIADIFNDGTAALTEDGEVDISSLTYDDVGYHLSEMAPPFIDEASCLVPGEAVVRVEKAPDNSRRIFAGIDIPVGVEAVWQVLTDYAGLQRVVPNLTVNEVLTEYAGKPPDEVVVDSSLSDEEQCEAMSKQLKGSLLKQVGGAKVVGINFSARTTLEVREWPEGLPDFAHFRDDVFAGKSRDDRAMDDTKMKLERYRFPRPFAVSRLPSRDISMQSIENDDGEFRMYQGVWRMQPLPGCAPNGQEAMRLTYAVEISPRAYLPVSIVEGRIVKDMCTNLVAIRDYVTTDVPAAAS
mmetsp:Transcript_5531/g.9142  ORF Transcript_5531/g.9142 Transcript_5531/m.9142 type:complete len:568 (+) Transcript_5531:2-1705(+)